MKYIKGIIFGAVASVVASILYIVVTIIIAVHNAPQGVEIGFDLRSMFVAPSLWAIVFWLTAAAAFALGFWLVVRRAS